MSPSEPTAFRYPLWRHHCPHPPREARFSTRNDGGRKPFLMDSDLWLCSVLYHLHTCQMKCISVNWNTRFQIYVPKQRIFQSGNVPVQTVYLVHLFTFASSFGCNSLPSLLSSPPLSYQISFHLCPHVALIFICVLACPTEGTQLCFDGAYGS